MPAVLARIVPPAFAGREFQITDYGAVADGSSDGTEAIRKAVDACSAAKGGRVLVPPGVFLTGPIHLKSNVNLHLLEGATLKFVPEPAKYMPVKERIYGMGQYLRPNFIQPYRCRNVFIEGITIKNSPMWEIHPVLCTNVIVRGVTMKDGRGGVVMGSEISGIAVTFLSRTAAWTARIWIAPCASSIAPSAG